MSEGLYARRRVLWMPLSVPWRPPTPAARQCCEDMRLALYFGCAQHADPFACADGLVVYDEVFDEYGIPVHDGGASYVLISHCPFCGAGLPASQRDRWLEETGPLLAAKGSEADLPERYRNGDWRRRGDPA